jgi:ADP-heptose:LPS heptosyltransferase
MIAEPFPEVMNLCGNTNLVEMCQWLKAVDLAITVDSGPMHAAAALGVPVLALFGPTDPVRVGPYGDRHRVLQSAAARRLARANRSWKRTPGAAMKDIRADDVASAAMEMLR